MSGLSPENVLALRALPLKACIEFWDAFEAEGRRAKNLAGAVRALCLADLYYLLVRACRREDMLHPWIYARTREVEACPDETVDLWFREGYKSTIKTFGLTIQDILKDPEITFGFFSHTRPIAKAFLRQIMREFESNKILHNAFPDVLWGSDTKQAQKWSEDDGIIVRRKSNPNEATIEAWGLVDGQPTSKHFAVLNYDDIVTDKSVTTADMIAKTTDALALSYNLGKMDGRKRFTGTFYHFGDTYREIIKRGTAVPRIHPATDDGTEYGKSVLLSQAALQKKRKDMGPYIFSCQMLLNPKADVLQNFRREWLRRYKQISHAQFMKMTRYLLVDPASAKKKGSDRTCIGVVCLGMDGNYYLADGVRDRLNLTERTQRLFDLHSKWKIKTAVRYEKYGMQADIEHIASEMEARNYRFQIEEVGGQTKKEDRIGRLIPLFEQGKFWLPEHLYVTDYEKITRDVVHDFVEEEYLPFPNGSFDDFFDMLARIAEPDMPLSWPKEERSEPDRAQPVAMAWMS